MAVMVRAAHRSEVGPARGAVVEVQGTAIALFQLDDGRYCAVSEHCPHRAGPLSRSRRTGTVIHCPWHGARFDLLTGESPGGPAEWTLRCYPVELRGDELFLDPAGDA